MIRRGLHAARRTTRLALMPPKAKELVSAVRIGMGRATFGTASTGHLASASRQLMVGGATFSRTAPIVTTSSSAPAAPRACPWMGFVEETGRVETAAVSQAGANQGMSEAQGCAEYSLR